MEDEIGDIPSEPIHILNNEEVLRLKHRDFIYAGDMLPKLDERQHADFLFHVQMSLLLCMEKRNLLTYAQRERCATMLENQYKRMGKKHAEHDCLAFFTYEKYG